MEGTLLTMGCGHGHGQKKRRQRAFRIGPVASMTKTQARDKLRKRMAEDLGITGDSRIALGAFIKTEWQPMREEGGWRDSTKGTNADFLKVITDRFGDTPIEEMDTVEMQIA